MMTYSLSDRPEDLAKAAALLAAGEVVAIPTETVYGLAADALNPDAVRRIFAAKGRPMDNPLIVHIADIAQWDALVTAVTPTAKALADAFWPGPLTIILPHSDAVPDAVTAGLSTVAVRFPAHPVAQALIKQSGCVLAAPSANRSGSPSPTSAAHVRADLDGAIAAIVDGGASEVGVESTVVAVDGDRVRVLRPGGITPAMLEAVVGSVEVDPAVLKELEVGQVAASPGMKYKHYAPKAHVTLVTGGTDAFVRYVARHAAAHDVALCFEEDAARLTIPCVTYGKRSEPASAAHELFDALRRLDEQGATRVWAAAPDPDGIGLAVYNRLLRAAGFEVIDGERPAWIGLTGPTGAGKSTVAAAFAARGCAVIDADAAARAVQTAGSPCLAALAEVFGADILLTDGALDRAKLAEKAFASPAATAQLNAVTHPFILAEMDQRAAEVNGDWVIVDAPLLFEAGLEASCIATVAVLADANVRLARIMARDGLDEAAARRRMAAQPADAFYRERATYIIENNGDAAALTVAVDRILQEVSA